MDLTGLPVTHLNLQFVPHFVLKLGATWWNLYAPCVRLHLNRFLHHYSHSDIVPGKCARRVILKAHTLLDTMLQVVRHVTRRRSSIRLIFCRKCLTYVSRLWQTFSPASSATLSTTCAASSSVVRGSGDMTAGMLQPAHRCRFIQVL